MNVKRQEYDSKTEISTMDETEATRNLCLANVGPTDSPRDYRPCGNKMRRYRNGVTVCPVHGEMH